MSGKDGFGRFKGSEDYVASTDLRNAVNVAIALERPLLVRGEPGTGKTLLAHSIAKALGKRLIVWNIKSTTKAQEGLYVYDTVQRLNDSRFGSGDVSDISHYIKLGRLGEAFVAEEQVDQGHPGQRHTLPPISRTSSITISTTVYTISFIRMLPEMRG